jgi:hypothetical protein
MRMRKTEHISFYISDKAPGQSSMSYLKRLPNGLRTYLRSQERDLPRQRTKDCPYKLPECLIRGVLTAMESEDEQTFWFLMRQYETLLYTNSANVISCLMFHNRRKWMVEFQQRYPERVLRLNERGAEILFANALHLRDRYLVELLLSWGLTVSHNVKSQTWMWHAVDGMIVFRNSLFLRCIDMDIDVWRRYKADQEQSDIMILLRLQKKYPTLISDEAIC